MDNLANWSKVIEDGAAATREEHARIRREMGPPNHILIGEDAALFGFYRVEDGVLRFRLNTKNEIIIPSARLFTTDELKIMIATFHMEM